VCTRVQPMYMMLLPSIIAYGRLSYSCPRARSVLEVLSGEPIIGTLRTRVRHVRQTNGRISVSVGGFLWVGFEQESGIRIRTESGILWKEWALRRMPLRHRRFFLYHLRLATSPAGKRMDGTFPSVDGSCLPILSKLQCFNS